MKQTFYFVIPTTSSPLLESYITSWESQNEGLRALVDAIYVPTQEPANQNRHVLSRLSETIAVFGNVLKVHGVYGFYLVADDDQITAEIWAVMREYGVQKMSQIEFSIFKQSLQT